MQPNKTDVTKSATGTVIKINVGFLQGLLFGGIAWWMWPDHRFSFGWGLLTIVSALIASAFLIGALLGMIRLYKREKVIAQYMKLGERPKSSTLASDDALKKAGMR